jgi:hypothetical protein
MSYLWLERGDTRAVARRAPGPLHPSRVNIAGLGGIDVTDPIGDLTMVNSGSSPGQRGRAASPVLFERGGAKQHRARPASVLADRTQCAGLRWPHGLTFRLGGEEMDAVAVEVPLGRSGSVVLGSACRARISASFSATPVLREVRHFDVRLV